LFHVIVVVTSFPGLLLNSDCQASALVLLKRSALVQSTCLFAAQLRVAWPVSFYLAGYVADYNSH
jgi:hypothetical protein